ncbi:MAG: DUF2236 domain-containing protein [Myxococcales bacterium]|nr:DUF2236 domain-containing protein [Myxococcales bacterium]
MTVTRADLEERLAWVETQARDPIAGIYEPGSVSWQLNSEAIVFLGAGRAALLQLAHPFVAQAIADHSSVRADPLGRFRRTFEHVYTMIFSPLADALESARRVHAIHCRVYGALTETTSEFGARYRANDVDALLWVYATLVETAVQVRELVFGPLELATRERYYQESWRFAALFGIPQAALPRDWAAFLAYNEAMWRALPVGEPARAIRRFLFASPRGWQRSLLARLELVTAGLMPATLRDPFELSFTAAERAAFQRVIARVARVYPRLPGRLRHVPAYVEARARLAGRPGPDRVGRLLERLALALIDKGAE